MSRGNGKAAIFRNDVDRRSFLQTLAEACAKVRLARVLRKKTTMTLGEVAEQLQMGAPGHLSHLLYWEGKTKPKAEGTKAESNVTKVRPLLRPTGTTFYLNGKPEPGTLSNYARALLGIRF